MISSTIEKYQFVRKWGTEVGTLFPAGMHEVTNGLRVKVVPLRSATAPNIARAYWVLQSVGLEAQSSYRWHIFRVWVTGDPLITNPFNTASKDET